MKQFLFIVMIGILAFGAWNCSDDDINAKIEDSWYDLEDDPNDPVQHYVYELHKNCGTILLLDSEVRDYQFNFTKKNNIRIVSPEQDKELLQRGLSFAREIFLDLYSDEFKKAYFPYHVILADSILFLGMEDEVPSYHAFASTNFVAIAGIRQAMKDYTEQEIKEIKSEVNGKFWNDYLSTVLGAFVFPDEFYAVSAEWYGKYWMDGETPDDIDCHEMGFVDFDWNNTSYDDDPIWGGWWVQVPDEKMDKAQWMAFMFNSTAAEREAMFAKYPLMEKKYMIIKEAMKQCGGFDVSAIE